MTWNGSFSRDRPSYHLDVGWNSSTHRAVAQFLRKRNLIYSGRPAARHDLEKPANIQAGAAHQRPVHVGLRDQVRMLSGFTLPP